MVSLLTKSLLLNTSKLTNTSEVPEEYINGHKIPSWDYNDAERKERENEEIEKFKNEISKLLEVTEYKIFINKLKYITRYYKSLFNEEINSIGFCLYVIPLRR